MKNRRIESVRNAVGWIYPDLPWFSEKDAVLANKQRDELLEALFGWVTGSFRGSKLHSGALSPGCSICGGGGWGCNFMNGLCTRHCFFCPQEFSDVGESDSYTDGMKFRSPAEHVSFLKIFKIRGVGFSGGEPLLALEKLLDHISAIKKEFGNSLYLWMYTNGDRVDRSTLKELKHAGLDEIRFNLSAREYDMAPVALSKGYIPAVTVEIPAIPEDLVLLKDLMVEMEKAGVDFLNLHQLYVCSANYKALRQRNYHFLHQPNIPVFESEICALNLLLSAREQGIRLPINYCCVAYKDRFQGRAHRMRKSRVLLKGFEEVTSAGYIRSFIVMDSKDKIEGMVRRMENAICPVGQWQCDARKTEVAIHSDLLPYVDWSSGDVTIAYLNPGVGMKNPEDGMKEENLESGRSLVYRESGWSKIGIETWRRLHVEKMNPVDAFRFFYRNYPAQGKDAIARLQKEAEELKKLAAWEELESGLPQVY